MNKAQIKKQTEAKVLLEHPTHGTVALTWTVGHDNLEFMQGQRAGVTMTKSQLRQLVELGPEILNDLSEDKS